MMTLRKAGSQEMKLDLRGKIIGWALDAHRELGKKIDSSLFLIS
jgi:hypothetical protein